MGAPHFQHVREFIAFAVEGIHEVQHDLAVVFHAVNQCHAECSWIGVVGGLRAVDVVVRADDVVRAFRMPHDFERDVRQHFVHIHIGRCARATLNHVCRELIDVLSFDQAVTRL